MIDSEYIDKTKDWLYRIYWNGVNENNEVIKAYNQYFTNLFDMRMKYDELIEAGYHPEVSHNEFFQDDDYIGVVCVSVPEIPKGKTREDYMVNTDSLKRQLKDIPHKATLENPDEYYGTF